MTAPGELERGTAFRRFACSFVDGLVLGIPMMILMFALAAAHSTVFMIQSILLVYVGIEIVYFGQMHGSRGQTLGKMAGKLVVVNLDGSPISKRTAYIRALAYMGPSLIGPISQLSGVAVLAGIGAMLGGLYWIASVIVALVDRDMQRAIHDRVAGTRVVVKQA